MASQFTIIDDGRSLEVQAEVRDARVTLAARELQRALGWTLKSEGLCRGEVCVPVRDRAALLDGEDIELAAFASVLGRPVVIDPQERAAALGTATTDQAARMATLEAPDFTLPDLEGKLHSLSDHLGKKVLLIAYASW